MKIRIALCRECDFLSIENFLAARTRVAHEGARYLRDRPWGAARVPAVQHESIHIEAHLAR